MNHKAGLAFQSEDDFEAESAERPDCGEAAVELSPCADLLGTRHLAGYGAGDVQQQCCLRSFMTAPDNAEQHSR
jgi:hypothetical protein